jgi:peptide/nickel transport system permease protein
MKGYLGYAVKRLSGTIVVLVAVTLVVFVVLERLVPGNLATVLVGGKAATPSEVHAVEEKLGLTRPILLQYVSWLAHAVRGNLGRDPITGLPIDRVIAQEAPESLELGIGSLVLATIVGVPVGVLSSLRAGKASDAAIRLPLLVLLGIPFFISGSLLLIVGSKLVPGAYSAVYVPLSTSLLGNIRSLLFPIIAAGVPVGALLAQMTRTAMLDVLRQDYIRTARSLGASRLKIAFVYGLKAAAPPILSLEGFTFGILVGSLIVVEQVFSLPGLGRGVLSSLGNRDFSLLDAQILVLAGAYIAGNLIVDLVIPIVDRRLMK